MNDATRFIMGIYQVSLMVRDTLEYVQGRPEHDVNFYNQRKQIINHGLVENSPLSHFLAQNGEVGEKIRANINEFIEFAYSEDSTYITLENGKIIVDHAQDLKALDLPERLKSDGYVCYMYRRSFRVASIYTQRRLERCG